MGNTFTNYHHIDHAWIVMPRSSRAKRCLIGVGLILYLVFRLFRDHMSPGFFRSSFPSLLFLPIALPIVDEILRLQGGNERWSEAPGVILISAMVACLSIEGIAPFLKPSAIGDWRDVLALMLGGLFYYVYLPKTRSGIHYFQKNWFRRIYQILS